MDLTSRSDISALRSCERIGTAASKAGAPCSIRSPAACAIPYILRPRSMTTTAALAGSCRLAYRPQRVVAFDIGQRLLGEAQGLRGIDWGCRWRLALGQEENGR